MDKNTGNELIESLTQARDLLRAGRRDQLSMREVGRIPPPRRYSAAGVRALRRKLNTSQSVFAAMLGVSAVLVQSWEQGKRTPSPLARRLLDVVKGDLAAWRQFVRAA